MLLDCELGSQIYVGYVDVPKFVRQVELLRLVVPANRRIQALVGIGHAEEVFPLFLGL